MSYQNPQVEPPHAPSGNDAIQPQAPDFVETGEVEPLSFDREPLPIWLYLLCGFILFLAGSSFTGFGIFGRDMLDQGPGGPALPSGSQATASAPATPADIGRKLYNGNCANCHQNTGEGQPGSYPSLVNSEYVLGSKERLATLLLAGVSGPIKVKGSSFGTQAMPGWAPVFSDEKLADIMTYLRSAWGNTAGPVTAQEVAAARAKFGSHLGAPFTEAELMSIAPNGPDPTDKKP